MSESQRKRTKIVPRPQKKYARKSKYAPKITSITQVAYLGTIQSTATGDSLSVLKFNFDDVPGYTDLAAVFDQYKLDKVDLRFVPNGTNIPVVAGTGPGNKSILYTAFDPNDATAPSTLNELIQYQNCSQTPYLEEYRRTVYPRLNVNSSDEEGEITLGAAGTWCATSQKDVDWYGLKVGASANGNSAGSIQSWIVLARFYFSFKNIK